jgi:hypothetical protein
VKPRAPATTPSPSLPAGIRVRTLTTLVTGGTAGRRETLIATMLSPGQDTALILEGLPDGATAFSSAEDDPALRVVRIAPACPCCAGNLTMRVTLNRILRHPPARLFFSLAAGSHLDTFRAFLTATPYDAYLRMTDDRHCA